MIKKFLLTFLVFILASMFVWADEISVKLTPLDSISTSRVDLREGDKINLIVTEDVLINSKVFIKQGSVATGIITSLVDNGFTCQEASIYAENFRVKTSQGKSVKLDGIVYKQGRNHSYFSQFLADGFFFIRGGEAKIEPKKDTYILYVKGTIDEL